MSERASTLGVVLVWALLACVWGSSWSVLKVGFRDIPPFALLALRMGLASAACFAWALAGRGFCLPARGGRRWLAVAVLGQGLVMNALLFWGGNRLDSGLTGLLFATTPLWAMLLGQVAGWEPMRLRPALGVLVGLGGLLLALGPALAGPLDGLGVAAILLGACVCGTTASVIKRHSAAWDIPSVLALQFGLAAVFGGVLHAGFEVRSPQLTWTAMAAVAYLGLVASVLTYAGVFWLYRRISAVSTTMLVMADASVALLLGVLWLREPFTWNLAGAGFAVLIGFLLTLEAAPKPPGDWV